MSAPASSEVCCPECGYQLSAGEDCPRCLAASCLLDDFPGAEDRGTASWGKIGRYELVELVGRGGMGMVFKARNQDTGEIVALKTVPEGVFANERTLSRFRNEVGLLSRLDHPAIVRVHEMGEDDGRLFFAMDFIEGTTLDKACRNGVLGVNATAPPARQREEIRQVATFAELLAHAVAAAHQQGVIHRDLKPSNILIDRSGMPHVTDFGLAHDLLQGMAEGGLTVSGQILGTPHFMAPEQVEGHETDRSTDVWGLGAILYLLLGGRPPFVANREFQLLNQIVHNDPVPPTSLNPAIPLGLELICLNCLEKKAGRRYPDAGALAEDLKRFLTGKPLSVRPPSSAVRWWKWFNRHRKFFVPLAAFILALTAGSIFATRAWFRESEARKKLAETESLVRKEAMRSELMAGFLSDLVRGVDPATARNRDTTLLQGILKNAAQRAEQLGEYPEVKADLHQLLGESYDSLAEPAESYAQFLKCWELRKEIFGPSHNKSIIAMVGVGKALSDLQRFEEAGTILQEALALADGEPGRDVPRAHSHFLLGRTLLMQGRNEEARKQLELCLAETPKEKAGLEPVAANFLLAGLLVASGETEAARQHYDKCLDDLAAAGLVNHPFAADTHMRLAELEASESQWERAGQHVDRAMVLFEQINGPRHRSLMAPLLLQSDMAEEKGDPARREQAAGRAWGLANELGEPDAILEAGLTWGSFLEDATRFDEAEPVYLQLVGVIENNEYEADSRTFIYERVRDLYQRWSSLPGKEGKGAEAKKWDQKSTLKNS